MDAHTGLLFYIKLHDSHFNLPPYFVPCVSGSFPLLGSWDPFQAIAMERSDVSTWELKSIIPPPHGNLEYKFLLRDTTNPKICISEENPSRHLVLGEAGDSGPTARFHISAMKKNIELYVSLHLESISLFSLATIWKTSKEGSNIGTTMHNLNIKSKDTNVIEKTEICSSLAPTISCEDHEGNCNTNSIDRSNDRVDNPVKSASSIELFGHASNLTKLRNRSVSVQDLVVLGSDSGKVFGTENGDECSSPKAASESGYSLHGQFDNLSVIARPSTLDISFPREKGMLQVLPPQMFVGRDQRLVPKERRRLAIIMVGLPARGKTFTATKLTRYLRWLGHVTKHFNVGQYRRIKLGHNQNADFFRSDNQEGLDARNEVASLAMQDMLNWMQEGGQIGIFDATNSTTERRKMLMKMCEGKCKVIFLEVICNDRAVINRNIRLKIQQSPDYVDTPDFQAALNDFKARLMNYEKAYEPVAEGSFIKMVDTVGGEGGQLQINNIGGYLPGRILFFLVNTHTNPRPIFLSRPGESVGTILGSVGGDYKLSEIGEKYAVELARFINERLEEEQTASVWTSTLRRTIATAQLVNFPRVEWKALDDINVGICDGMTYEDIKTQMPEEYKARCQDKLRYRYPRGESYLDVIQRLEPVIIELERQHAPVVIIAHQAVLRALYGYFADKPIEQIPRIEIPLHTVIEIQMGAVGVDEKRYKLL